MKEFAQYYYFIYWLAAMMLTWSKYLEIQPQNGYSILYKRESYSPLIIFTVFYVLFFGFRPISMAFWDTVNYNTIFQMMQTYGTMDAELPEEVDSDWIFYHFMFFCSQIVDIYCFLAIIMYFYVVMMLNGCKKIDPWHGSTLMIFCIGAFSFYWYSVNGIRNGVACSFVILALGSVCRGQRIWPIILSFIAIGCHKSTALPLACMFFTYFVRNPKYMFYAWIGAIGVSLLLGEAITSLFSLLSYDERLADIGKSSEAIAEEWGEIMENRFRWDFLLYSAMPILLGWYTLFVRKVYNNTYLMLLGTYMYANLFWIIVIRDVFSNRYAYLSWFLYPIVLAYPLLNLPVFEKNHSQKTAWILMAHFGFTTLMWLLGR